MQAPLPLQGCDPSRGLLLKVKLQLLWPPDAKSQLMGKDPDAGKNSRLFHSQNYGFSSSHVWMGCKSWAIKKAEPQRIDAFELWCWRRPLRVPWTARRSNQSVLKEINSEYLPEGLVLKLKLQYFGHLMQRANSWEKTQMLGKIQVGGERDDRGWDGRMASLIQQRWISANSWR